MTRFRPFLALIAIIAALVLVAGDVDARPSGGKSFGSRGSKTFAPPAATNTAPGAAPMQRTTTTPGAPGATTRPNAAPAAAPAGGMFGGARGLMGGLAAGFLGAGLIGMLFGGGFMSGLGGFASMLGMLIQIGLVVVVAMLAWNWWKRRQAGSTPATASGPAFDRVMNRDASSPYEGSAYTPSSGFGGTTPGAAGAGLGGSALGGMGLGRMGAAQAEAPVIGEANIDGADFDTFERLLTEVSQAYGREDLGALRTRATPEMLSYFSEELADKASKGLANEVSDIKLLQGDLSEAWRENDTDYATVAMRYSITDATVDRATNKVVEGSREPAEVTEFWTFRRAPAGQWVVSGIQQTQ
ncbi:MAG: methyltransferase, YaeB/AF family [Xanthobacteraceae bacterium]|jgi:predicted lipid-binding transport protein (Tim44 family)|nr:methyltransferase, YaeB/AF family [Xanthobacteraceae bacterium]